MLQSDTSAPTIAQHWVHILPAIALVVVGLSLVMLLLR